MNCIYISQSIWQTINIVTLWAWNAGYCTAKKKSSAHMALGEKAVVACFSPKYLSCLLALCFLQDNMCLITTEQTCVSVRHECPYGSRCYWIPSHWSWMSSHKQILCGRAIQSGKMQNLESLQLNQLDLVSRWFAFVFLWSRRKFRRWLLKL